MGFPMIKKKGASGAMHVIAVSNQKGGCGKTTTAINLAASFASFGKKTLLVDLDPQAHATYGLGIRDEKLEASMYNVLTDEPERRKEFIEDVVIPIDEGLDCAPSHILLSTIEQEFTSKEESVSKLYDALQTLSFPYDYIVIDCPPSLGFLTFNALRASQTVLVPIELSSFSLMGVDKLLSMIELIRVKLKHTPKVYSLATIVDMRSKLSRHMLEAMKEAFGEHTLSTVIHQSVSIKESQARGVSTLSYDKKAKGALDYLILCQELMSKISPQERFDDEKILERLPANLLKDFMLERPGAREVHVVGDFNNWSPTNESLLWQKEEGTWQKRLFLEPGRYRYKFIVDGEWTTDPKNDQIEPNPYGGLDSILEVR
jgi:chromosome partitioning protein